MENYSKLYSVLSYITWIGWIFAFLQADREDPLVRQHLNQSLVINIASILAYILTGFGGIGFGGLLLQGFGYGDWGFGAVGIAGILFLMTFIISFGLLALFIMASSGPL